MFSLLIIFALVSIVTSFMCSMWEAVLLSITPSYAQVKMREDSATGKKIQEFKSNIDRPLAAILTLNTIAHTVGAIGVGAQSAQIWGATHPFITTVIVPVAMTAAILILSEIIPKTLGANFWKTLAPFTVRSLTVIIKILYPLVWFCQLITKNLKNEKGKSVLSRSDFMVMTEIGHEKGIFKKDESDFIKNLLGFNQITVKDIMTPRVVVKAVPETMTLNQFYEENKDTPFSRIPIYKKDKRDSITGFVLKTEIFKNLLANKGEGIVNDIKRDITAVPEGFKVQDLFNLLLEKREHMALVVDEFGGMSGIATMEDIIETLLGMEIIDELDSVEDMQAFARQKWAKRAKMMGLIVEESEVFEILIDKDKNK